MLSSISCSFLFYSSSSRIFLRKASYFSCSLLFCSSYSRIVLRRASYISSSLLFCSSSSRIFLRKASFDSCSFLFFSSSLSHLVEGIAKSVVSGVDVETNPVSNPSQSLHYLYENGSSHKSSHTT